MTLGELVNITTGKLDANAAVENGKFPFFTCAKNHSLINDFAFDKECVLVAGNGELNVKYYNGKFNAYQRTYVIDSKDTAIVLNKYLYYFLKTKIDELRYKSKGGVIKYIKLGNLTNLKIAIPKMNDQMIIVKTLDKINTMIENKKEVIDNINKIVSDKFFIDIIDNSKYERRKICNLVEKNKNSIKAGPFGTSLKKEVYAKEGFKIYGQEQVISNDVSYGNYYIDEKKYNELINYKVKENDVLISLVGTYGKVLVIPDKFEPGIINPRLMKISFDKTKMNPYFFKYLFASPEILKIINHKSHGGVMGILNSTNIRNMEIIAPPIEKQNEFLEILNLRDKIIKENSLDIKGLEELLEAKMHEYFD